MCYFCTYAPFFRAIFEGASSPPPSLWWGGRNRGRIFSWFCWLCLMVQRNHHKYLLGQLMGLFMYKKNGQYNRQRSVVKNRPLSITLSNFKSRNNYNKNIHSGSKEPITADTYNIPRSCEKYASCLFFGVFSSFSGGEQPYFRASFPSPSWDTSFWFVWGGVLYGIIPFEVHIDNAPPITKNEATEANIWSKNDLSNDW